ncbi:universal stress protein [Streptomyces sp. NPDC020379]|uniref:universal stress protein n=1 Tax=Streptomyces sp. NPDC020379 TaxID=3365071 RepID=UPI0037979024
MAGLTRVVVGVDGGPDSAEVLLRGAGEALDAGADLCPVITWTPPDRQPPDPTHPSSLTLKGLWAAAARDRLQKICETVLDVSPEEIRVRPLVVPGPAGGALVALLDRSKDLLVVGAGTRGRGHRNRLGPVTRFCLAHAPCPVLVVPSDARSGSHGV